MLAGLVVYEGIHRLVSPPEPEGLPILVVALVGVVVNLVATFQLSKANRSSMNAIRCELEHIRRHRFGIDHTTLEVDHGTTRLLSLEPGRRA